MDTAIFGGGCFWCLEAVFQRIQGVGQVESGYMGGPRAEPTYEEVCEKNTGHAEVVRVSFDAQRVTYQQLLDIFFEIHDPTTVDRQGNDIGPQYRSIIFAMNPDQARLAAQVIDRHSGAVTQLVELDDQPVQPVEKIFWPAEENHQNYYRNHPTQGYCMFVVAPKVAHAEQAFKALIAQ
ncbi:MAG: peptide-methionine (S)-S-oxide reductase MsrA [Burkholderiaceae bacterium]|jgi:peptide-methionine (S)-S-oxide reductase